MERKIYNFDKLDDCYSFNSATVSYIIDDEKRLKGLLKDKDLSDYERRLIQQRIGELQYMYSDHGLISTATNDQLLNAVCQSLNALNELGITHYNYYFPFGIFGDLEVENDYLSSIQYDTEKFREDLFNKLGFEYKHVNEIITKDRIDFDELHRNGLVYSIDGNRRRYGVNFSFYDIPDLYLKNKDSAPKVKRLQK